MKIYFLFCLILGLSACHTNEQKGFESKTTDEGVCIFENGDTVLFYQSSTKSRSGEYPRADYIHPLYNLKGEIVTEDFPEDHLHQRGIFWTWHQVWIGERRIGDAWEIRDFLWDVQKTSTSHTADGSIILNTETLWKSPIYVNEKGVMEPFARETAGIKVYPAEDNFRMIDFEIHIHALADELKIGGSEDPKGYSGFSVRMKLSDDVTFKGEDGIIEPQNLAVKAGPWVDISGTWSSGRLGIIIIDHPDNPGFPQPWILRKKESMQNPAYPGRVPVEIPRAEPLVLKYRLVIHHGDMETETISNLVSGY